MNCGVRAVRACGACRCAGRVTGRDRGPCRARVDLHGCAASSTLGAHGV